MRQSKDASIGRVSEKQALIRKHYAHLNEKSIVEWRINNNKNLKHRIDQDISRLFSDVNSGARLTSLQIKSKVSLVFRKYDQIDCAAPGKPPQLQKLSREEMLDSIGVPTKTKKQPDEFDVAFAKRRMQIENRISLIKRNQLLDCEAREKVVKRYAMENDFLTK